MPNARPDPDELLQRWVDEEKQRQRGKLTIFFGAALGNVVRGVPIGADDYFFLSIMIVATVRLRDARLLRGRGPGVRSADGRVGTSRRERAVDFPRSVRS